MSTVRYVVLGLLALLTALPLAYLIHLINDAYQAQPEKAALVAAKLLVIIFVLPPALYLLFKRKSIEPSRLGLILLATVAVLLVSIYLYWVSLYVFFPADILLWSESDFVNDILKFRFGYPIYSAQANNESFVYTPGAQIITYLISWLMGNASSIPLWRIIQLGYVLLAAIVAVFCCRRLVDMSMPARWFRDRFLWCALWLSIFFLMASNSLTNAYVHTLHNDALALLASVVAYWLLLKYISTRDNRVLALMAFLPAAGFLVKQSLAIWAPLYCLYLIFFERPRSIARLLIFSALTFGLLCVTVGGCYLLWREHFVYWIFTAIGNDPVSPLRSLKHIMDVWAYFAIGLLGGLILLRGRGLNQLLGSWLIWLVLISIEASSSGIGWMLNHMGPGSLIAGIWFFAALARIWPSVFPARAAKFRLQTYLRAGILLALVGLLFSGLGFLRVPVKHLSDDTYRYVRDIEREFEGQPVENILLDAGTWIYLEDGVIMKDRGIPFGNRGYNGTGDFSGMIRRLNEKHYSKIIVRNLESPIFLYDHWLWPKPSGIKRALLENYHETKKIKAVEKKVHKQIPYYFFDEITILEPNSD